MAATSNRRAVETFELVGHTVRAGTQINISLTQANRDEGRFPDPDQLRLDREPSLAVPAGRPTWRNDFMSGLNRLPVAGLSENTWRTSR